MAARICGFILFLLAKIKKCMIVAKFGDFPLTQGGLLVLLRPDKDAIQGELPL